MAALHLDVSAATAEVIAGDFGSDFMVARLDYLAGTVYEVRIAEGAPLEANTEACEYLPPGAVRLGSVVQENGILAEAPELVLSFLIPEG